MTAKSDKTDEAQIRSDLAAVAPYTRTVRTYSVGNGLDRVPELASEYGLSASRSASGSMIRRSRTSRRSNAAIELANTHRNIDSVIVGNETIYRNKALYERENVEDLIAKIQRVKRSVRVPVTTAEVWDIWLEHPELVSAVDYLAVHILPYWEGLPGRPPSITPSRSMSGCAKPIRASAS